MNAQAHGWPLKAGRLFIVLVLGVSLAYLPVAAQEETASALEGNVPGQRSEMVALSLSVAGILLFWAVAKTPWLGLWLGPAFGYFYSGLWGRGLLGIGIRGVAGAVAVAGGLSAFTAMFSKDPGAGSAGALLALAGAAVFIGSALWDIMALRGAVRRHNASLLEKHLSVAPFYLPQSKAVGIQLRFSF